MGSLNFGLRSNMTAKNFMIQNKSFKTHIANVCTFALHCVVPSKVCYPTQLQGAEAKMGKNDKITNRHQNSQNNHGSKKVLKKEFDH